MNKKPMKKIIGCIAAALVLTAVCLSLNSIVSYFLLSPEEKVIRVDFNDYADVGKAYALINNIDILNEDIKERINCNGWAFVETQDSNAEKTGNLILKGRKNCYMTAELPFRISTIQQAMPNWKKIQGDSNNYALTFSTLQLPDDIYEIYIYVEENENAKGIVDTGAGFRKEGVDIQSFTDVTFCDIPKIEESWPVFDHGWWDMYDEGTHLRIQGWEIKEGIASEDFTYYGAFVGENGKVLAFKMPSINHASLGAEFGVDYISSGFAGYVEYEKLPDSAGVWYMLAEHEGNWYRTEAYVY